MISAVVVYVLFVAATIGSWVLIARMIGSVGLIEIGLLAVISIFAVEWRRNHSHQSTISGEDYSK